jgi:opacity protein-like surface antigen
MKRLLILAVLAVALIGMAGAANYMYEKASVKGVGYKNVEMIISTQTGFNGQKLGGERIRFRQRHYREDRA